jgi:hypothetical protein
LLAVSTTAMKPAAGSSQATATSVDVGSRSPAPITSGTDVVSTDTVRSRANRTIGYGEVSTAS